MKIALTIPGLNGNLDSGLPKGVPTGGLFDPGGNAAGNGIVIIRTFIILFVVITVLMGAWLIWKSGWDMITSHGQKENWKRSWQSLSKAILGLFFLFLTFILIGVVNALFGTDMFPFLKFK
jgi:hypothetical protein